MGASTTKHGGRSGSGRGFVGLVGLLTLGVLGCGGSATAEPEPKSVAPSPRPEMHQIFEAVSHLLPLAMSAERWSDPAHQAEIDRWVAQLSNLAGALEAHAGGRDVGFRYLSDSLSANVSEMRARRELGRLEQARFYMIETTGSCVACHSRLPSARSFPMAENLISSLDMSVLAPNEKAHVYVATRQFDAVLDLWESTFSQTGADFSQLDLDGYLLDYLIISIRVERDAERALATMDELLGRDGLPAHIAFKLKAWRAVLEEHDDLLTSPPKLAQIRNLVLAGSAADSEASASEQEMRDLIASSVLHRLLDGAAPGDERVAEAYYLLGLIESRSVDSFWVPQAEFHLETSIRTDPGASHAEDAFATYEGYVNFAYGGASGSELPADIRVTLAELRRLIDEASETDGGGSKSGG